ncbi:RNA methyltransferase [uncultured Hyphomonas sp.]|uniref:TrmH family RNA methyltransferase n=1 Tax=uncultured Hyphomonas sp. TaxID=225298 RepID=UPI002AAB7451|nr:RNA methyltransferase [uncultured Hyphomonas sp.]
MARNHGRRRNAQGRPGRPQDGSQPQGHRPGPRHPNKGHTNDDSGLWIWGIHAVEAALANPERKLIELLATENAAARLPTTAPKPHIVTAKDIDTRLPPGSVHQGLALRAEPLDPIALEDLIHEGVERIVVLDQVSDPHNLGAIYRSAAAFGFGAIVLQTRNAPPITGIVAKSAVGAIETVAEARVVNISRALEQLGEAGYHTVGLAGEGEAEIAQAVKGAGKLAIVLGAEGPGLRPGVAKACAELARIPISAAMESLNVSNAAAIAFYEAARNSFPGD